MEKGNSMTTNQGTREGTVKTVANACVATCRKLTAQIEQAKHNLLAEVRQTFEAPEQLLRLALNEAEALAWQTEYPHLVFPDLAWEKVQAVAGWNARQRLIRQESAYAMSN